MNKQVFDELMTFHKQLIRTTHLEQTIEDAREGRETHLSKLLMKALNERFEVLTKWHMASDDVKFKLYCLNKTRKPRYSVFKATMAHMRGKGIAVAAREFKVNAMCIYRLKQRVERYNIAARNVCLLK